MLIGEENIIPGRGVQEFFGGIRFAEPPVGSLRFAPPVPKYNLDVPVFNATEYSLLCPQSTPFGGPPSAMSEDCLTVNVVRPKGVQEDASLPVMVWMYGLGFQVLNSSKYDPSPVVLQSVERGTPVIFVSFNYRLGPFGFPQGYEATARGALNLGLQDQLVALEWIQRNIAAFGGDPNKVTLWGEASGASSISFLYLNQKVDTFARAAILESGAGYSLPTYNSTHFDGMWQIFVEATPECAGTSPNNTFACLREANLTTLLNSFGVVQDVLTRQFTFIPVVDGPGGLIPELPSKLLADGHFSRLPFLTGTNLDEGTYAAPASRNATTPQDVSDTIYYLFSPVELGSGPQPDGLIQTTNTLLALYPNITALGSPFNTGNETFGLNPEWKRCNAILGDVYFQAPRRAWSHKMSKAGVKSFSYLFTDPQALDQDPTSVPGGVPHESEVTYAFGGPAFAGTPSPADSLSWSMMDYWISFAVNLDPNDGRGTQRPHWPQYTPDNEVLLQLCGDNTTVIPDDYRSVQIAFIEAIPEQFQQ
ncbi:Lipase 2 [Grifola frondosa]|uniref:Lipase 2 n=1 Tax=Grifola frondosa TaxID=5627 RepID=A0A1C7M7W4_GRIFR|nr:Lipase 2 [Grifola frondosa]